CFAHLAAAISRREKVVLVCRDRAHRRHIERQLERAGARPDRVRWAQAPSNDTWARDHGPITVLTDHGPRLMDFRFNGWGGKYPHDLDDALVRRLADQGLFTVPRTSVDLVLEGGAIESDGRGTVLTTARCLLSATRNPHLDRAGMERALTQWLGAKRVLWLERGGLTGDDTDGHIDTLARFCGPDTIAYQACDEPSDPDFEPLRAMQQELTSLRQANGERYRLVPLPWPGDHRNADGQRLPATYANFLIINGAVLMPGYGGPADAAAHAALADCFPDREVVTLDCVPLIQQFGSLHCVTMQFPAGVLED
ncbi:MAG: agmatine deiminase family protein, partial [Gammaproteobacteria bacterium]